MPPAKADPPSMTVAEDPPLPPARPESAMLTPRLYDLLCAGEMGLEELIVAGTERVALLAELPERRGQACEETWLAHVEVRCVRVLRLCCLESP